MTALVVTAASTAGAQTRRDAPEPDYPPRILIVNFPAARAGLGAGPAEAVRVALERAANGRLWVIGRNDVVNFLVGGYTPDTGSSLTGIRQLAQQLRADAVVLIEGTDAAEGPGRLAARLLQPADSVPGEPIAVVWARTLPAAAVSIAERLAADTAIVWRRRSARAH